MNKRTILSGCLLGLVCAAPAAAQIGPVQAGTGIRFELYSFSSPEEVDVDRVTLMTVPVGVQVPITPQLSLRVAGAYARGTLTRSDGVERELAGLTDTEVSLTASFANDRFRLTALGQIPTGTNELTLDEMDVAGVIAADLLPFAISNWGSGGGIGLSAAAALPAGENTSIGLSGGYVVAREFEPIADQSFAYRPGNQLHARAAIDHNFGNSGKGSLQLTYLQYGADEAAGSNLYQAGDRLQAVASYAFAAGAAGSGIVWGGYLRRQEGEYTSVALITPAQDMVYGGIGFRLPMGNVLLQPTADVRFVGNDDGIDQGYTAAAGTAVEIPLGRALLVPVAKARFGNLTVRSGVESTFTGFELGLSLRSGTVQP